MDFTPITQEDDTRGDEASDGEDVVVWQWRAQQLHRLGLSSLLAQTFAAVVDWHEFARLSSFIASGSRRCSRRRLRLSSTGTNSPGSSSAAARRTWRSR
jgi:hypothetical protein